MGANQNIPKNAEKFCGSFYKDDFSEFYPESVFRSENGSKLSIFGPKYVFFVNSVPDVCQIIKILKIYLLMLPMRIFCYLWNFRTTSQKSAYSRLTFRIISLLNCPQIISLLICTFAGKVIQNIFIPRYMAEISKIWKIEGHFPWVKFSQRICF